MSKIYLEALTEAERKAFPKLGNFADLGVLAGGTALTLQLQHRRSYDFDIFSAKIPPKTLVQKLRRVFGKISIINNFEEELTALTTDLKITFIYYPFKPIYDPISDDLAIKIFDWKDIALDKVYTIGHRAQYRDYVDLFWLIKNKNLSLGWLIQNAKKKFGDLFPEKLFLEQLIYFGDLEIKPIEFLKETSSAEEIKTFFEKIVKNYTKEKLP